jgi:hypothetical protein
MGVLEMNPSRKVRDDCKLKKQRKKKRKKEGVVSRGQEIPLKNMVGCAVSRSLQSQELNLYEDCCPWEAVYIAEFVRSFYMCIFSVQYYILCLQNACDLYDHT